MKAKVEIHKTDNTLKNRQKCERAKFEEAHKSHVIKTGMLSYGCGHHVVKERDQLLAERSNNDLWIRLLSDR